MITLGCDIIAMHAGGIMHTHDAATALHHRFELSKVLRRVGQAVRREKVTDEDDARSCFTLGLVRPTFDEVCFHARQVRHVLKAMLHQPTTCRNLVRTRWMRAWPNNDSARGGLPGRETLRRIAL